MIPLSQPTKVLEKTATKGVFEIEALYPGYGVTIGNSLRRVLLSSLEGAAITQVRIKGVPHEFSTIPGVIEDVLHVILNLKQMRFILHGQDPQTAILKVKGEKEVKGSDFVFPPQLELVNKDIPIASLSDKNAELEMEIQVEKGTGYLPVQAQKAKKTDIGIILLDAIFTPARRVNYRVDNMRVGERTDFDRLTIEITTDGTMSPETALYRAVDILLKEFQIAISSLQEEETKLPNAEEKKEKSAKEKKQKIAKPKKAAKNTKK
ncbi:MAG: DNA-directed RNA polymerase subunit alpha [Candidatus Wildermuthbacteria bacterium]|nr:DNA-directed RNA polymerase subunit alpha [Candidatus Wildermuthbacteria bacterium]